ncbi:hypothetical protein BMT55_16725 [Listeria newyorkensis]|uniref:YopX protein domain-containing protein n=1 Tax=Listeria newyorkensis TaxID=1497681 RepID=A0ABX4XIM0_9LIST|nr:YopX family protein [Listeria newyorkensis]KGL45706.1 hypothetical protein EP58_03165 [Listeria newyorkensis]PNP86912.1 hypothetical protein BMT55_16725 [Listeria newyorkensis]SQC55362.1 YopX protein [Listeria newyorkensis]
MRPIEFRAYDKTKKRWLNVDDFVVRNDGAVLLVTHTEDDCIVLNKADEEIELTEYTGLRDKNGNKIFEGDIGWDDHTECWGVVVFDEGKFLYQWETVSDDLWEVTDDIGIRGNIHNSPELLEGCAEE